MALKMVGPKEALEVLDSQVDQEKLQAALAEINAKLTDPAYLRGRFSQGKISAHFTFKGSVSFAEKVELSSAASMSGWSCEINNSEDKGERPGLWGIRLFMKSEGEENGTT